MARLVAVRIAEFLNIETGSCDPAYETLAEEIGIHRSSAIRAVAALGERGWLIVERSGGRHSNTFRLDLRNIDVAESPTCLGNLGEPEGATIAPCNRRARATVVQVRLK